MMNMNIHRMKNINEHNNDDDDDEHNRGHKYNDAVFALSGIASQNAMQIRPSCDSKCHVSHPCATQNTNPLTILIIIIIIMFCTCLLELSVLVQLIVRKRLVSKVTCYLGYNHRPGQLSLASLRGR